VVTLESFLMAAALSAIYLLAAFFILLLICPTDWKCWLGFHRWRFDHNGLDCEWWACSRCSAREIRMSIGKKVNRE
jgi:hypothetical protein